MIKTNLAIVLENIASGFSQPNILDVKIGSRLWADDAPLLKRQKLDKVASETTSGSLGYRIAGMKTWHGPEQDYLKYDKFYGRGFSVGTVKEGWRKYFLPDGGDGKTGGGVTCRSSRRIIKRCLGDLRGLLEVMAKEESRMYSASLLFVYEGDGAVLEQKFIKEKEIFEQFEKNENGVSEEQAAEEEDDNSDSEETLGQPKIQAVKVIDFAHATWTPGAGPDENFLRGIRHVILALEGLL
jgi:1D-myo-inositol-tetrakisphosphate 5-kinase/inositol-polyphosphate multikinase